MTAELRYANVTEFWYRFAGKEIPRQLDLLYDWFPVFTVAEDESDGETKIPPYFDEALCVIHAVRYHGRLYSGADEIIAQLCGRLIGSAKGNREKQRKNAVLMQKRIVRYFSQHYDAIEFLINHTAARMCELEEDALNELLDELLDYTVDLAKAREEMSDTEKDGEPFPMDDEIFDTVVYNAAYQLNLCTFESLARGYFWLLLGGLLRNEAGRLTRRFDSSFIEVNRMPSEEESLLSKLDYLFNPEDYEYVFSGDDFSQRFPDIIWKCDRCGDTLNEQTGFDDHLEYWQCRRCGWINPLSMEHIHDSAEDAMNGREPCNEEKFSDAIERRKKELSEQ